MSSERLGKVEEIFHAALELPVKERESFLAESCENDAALRREVESLLAFENESDSLIIASPAKIAAEMVSERDYSQIIGKQINQYKILSLLGEGGMGAVYLARDTTLERKVALKLLSGEFANDETRLNRFFQEAKSASALNHPNILTVHEIGETGGTHFIVTEFINGKTLKHYLEEEKPPLAEILELAAQIASALAAAHEVGIIHRDIKPDNVMVRNDRLVKILDFGIAKLSDANISSEIDLEAATRARGMTMPGMIIGTPQYMSPEQARGQKVDFRTDIFSFGVVLYEMITGRPPFSGVSNMDVIGAILKDEPAPLSEYAPEISHELEHIVEKTLRKDREQRYQHIKDLWIDLNDAKKTLEVDVKRIHRTDSDKARVTLEETSGIAVKPRFSFFRALLLLAVLAVIAGGIYRWMAARGGTAQTTADLKTVEVVNWASSPGEIYSVGSFSPNAERVAFASTKSGKQNIWVKQTAAGEAVQTTKDEFGNKNPVWSPSGEEIAFFSARGNQPGIWRIPYLGGSPSLVAALSDAGSLLRFWSKKNLIYFESGNELFAADANSGEVKIITDLKAKGVNAKSISLSPDEQKIAYITSENKLWSLWLKNLTEETPKKIVEGAAELKNTVWHPDNQRIFYSARADETFQIFVADAIGSPPKQISSGERDNLVLDVSSDGSKILFGSAQEESDLWGVNLKDSKEYMVASDIDSELWADASSNGKSIAYQSIKNLSQGNKMFSGNILTKNLDDKEKETVLVSNAFLPKWSPDGKTLAFIRVSGDKLQIGTVNANGGGQKSLTKEGVSSINFAVLPYNRTQTSDFSWSPDSQKIAYLSDQSGQSNIWLINADGSNDERLTSNDSNLFLSCPLWSADGKRIAFTAKTSNSEGKPTYSVSIIDVEKRTIDPISSGNTFIRLVGWTQSGKELILASVEKGQTSALPDEVSLLQLQVETKKMSEIVKLKETYLYNIHLSIDKKTIAFVAHRDGIDNVWTIPAAGGEAKQMTGNNDSRLYFSSLSWSSDSNFIFFGKQSRFSLLSMLTNFK